MRAEIHRLSLCILGPLVSGVFLVLAFPDYDVSWLVWVALVPLMLALCGVSAKQGFLLCFLFSVVLFTGVCRWIFEVSRYTLLHHLIVNLILGVPLAVFGWVFAYLVRRRGAILAFCASPFVWVALEYVRSNLSFFSLPWALLGHSQYESLPIIQISAVTGVYGVSFLIVLVNASLSAAALAIGQKRGLFRLPHVGGISRRAAVSLLLVSALSAGLVFFYGVVTLAKPIGGNEIKMSIIQGNIGQRMKWDPKYRDHILQRYTELSRYASKNQPAAILWPEAATPGLVLKDMALLKRITEVIRETNTYFLMGSSEYPKFAKSPTEFGKFGNTALFFSPQGKVLGQYLKIRLVPFAEYVPYEKFIPWPRFIVPEGMRSFEIPGEDITLFELRGVKFGVLICWETIFPDLFRQAVRGGASFMVNLTNEGWFNKSVIFYQYVAMNVFRAVENRVYLVRCANTGISCFIDPYGQVVNRVKDEEGREIFVPGVLTGTVVPSNSKTIYTRYGDWLPWLSIAFSVALMLPALLGRRKE